MELLETDDTGISDGDWIVSWLRERGYQARYYRIEALDYGSFPRRERCLGLILLCDSPPMAHGCWLLGHPGFSCCLPRATGGESAL